MKILTGNSNRELSKKVADYLGIDLSDALVTRYVDGEVKVQIRDSIRGSDVFIIQSTFPPAENIMELLLMIDAARRASARRITAVIPYFGYSRQGKKDEPRVPISARLISDMITSAGANRILALDLHFEQIAGFFTIPVDHLYSSSILVNHFSALKNNNFVIVSPDAGRVAKARFIAKVLGNLPLTIIDKRKREESKENDILNVIGNVKGKNVLIVDDIIDTGDTVINAVKAVGENGAEDVNIFCTHPLFSGNCLDKLSELPILELTYTDTIPVLAEKKEDWMREISIASLFGEAIIRIHDEVSLSPLFV